MIALSSTAGMLAAMRSARRVDFCSYFLAPGAVESGLEAAARRGAHVRVRLERALWGGSAWMRRANRDAVLRLRACGADVRLVHNGEDDGPSLHMKAAVLDGAAYLADCNWGARDVVIRDDARAHVQAARKACAWSDVPRSGSLSLRKEDAIAAETRAIQSGTRCVDVESEALRASSVSKALRELASRGVRCRVLLSALWTRSPASRAAIRSLQAAGVQIRAVQRNDKFAVSDSGRAWAGSADATSTYCDGDRIDWGLSIADPRIARALERRFEAQWRAAKAVPG